ncbi:MAG: glycoside hydrolase family 25 protein [Ruminococcus sp.]|nr:glycoside hydrolase family 25 protein [Ruminococcus sp.]
MSKFKGIDISHFQGQPDFAKVKTLADFVIMQAGYGRYSSQKDKTFERNYSECKKHGIPCGVYWFSYATTAEDARKEAQACLQVIKGKQFEYPIYFDVEGKSLVGRAGVSAMCKVFCGELEKAGYFAGIYISRSPAQIMLDDECRKKYALWLAEYASKLNWSGAVGMWQNSSTGRVSGISGNVDMDECYEDYPALIKQAGLNGFKAQAQMKEPETKILDKSGFKQGEQSLGIYNLKLMLGFAYQLGLTKVKLDPNGIFGKGTLNAVNGLLNSWGYEQNGIAGEKFAERLNKEILKKL